MAGKIKYKFFLKSDNLSTPLYCPYHTLDASDYAEVYPQYDDEFGIKWERQQDQIFFRKQIDGELTFACFNNIKDYNCLYSLPIDEEIYLYIFSSCDNYIEPIYTGYFTRRNIFWDENERVAIISDLITFDKYNCILKNWETEYNIAGLTDYTVNRSLEDEIFKYCKKITEVIQYFLDQMGCNFTYQSKFFENDLTGDTDNYVTEADPNPLNDLMISDKSNILAEAGGSNGGAGFDEATISNLSLKTLLDTLKNLYDIRWHIDSDGYFRIEHISFYMNALGTLPLNDLTTLINKYTNKEYAYRTNKYDYLDLPDREEFIYSEKNPNPDIFSSIFEDYFFDYTYDNRSPGGTKDTKEMINHTISGFTNDLNWLCNTVVDDTKAYPDGFTILQVIPDGGDYKVVSGNNNLSWNILLNNYWQDFRPFIYGYRGYIDTDSSEWTANTFNSKRRSKKQIPIEIHGCCDPFDDTFDIFDLIKTHLGEGEIYNFRYILSSGATTMELFYEAEDIGAAIHIFESTWKTNNVGISNDDQIHLPLEATGIYDFIVDWGDGNTDVITIWNQAETTHTYAAQGTYTIKIIGTINGWRFNNGDDKLKILIINSWGDLLLGDNNGYFYGCSNLVITATDILDVSNITTFFNAFRDCTSLDEIAVNGWEMNNVITLSHAFYNCTSLTIIFHAGIWDITSVTDMTNMFFGATLITYNYNLILTGWEDQAVQNNVTFHAGNSKYDGTGIGARAALIADHTWAITDGGLA